MHRGLGPWQASGVPRDPIWLEHRRQEEGALEKATEARSWGAMDAQQRSLGFTLRAAGNCGCGQSREELRATSSFSTSIRLQCGQAGECSSTDRFREDRGSQKSCPAPSSVYRRHRRRNYMLETIKLGCDNQARWVSSIQVSRLRLQNPGVAVLLSHLASHPWAHFLRGPQLARTGPGVCATVWLRKGFFSCYLTGSPPVNPS